MVSGRRMKGNPGRNFDSYQSRSTPSTKTRDFDLTTQDACFEKERIEDDERNHTGKDVERNRDRELEQLDDCTHRVDLEKQSEPEVVFGSKWTRKQIQEEQDK